jgi:hypothetical protein
MFPYHLHWENTLLKKQMVPQMQFKSHLNSPKLKRTGNVLNLSDKLKILDLLKSDMYLIENVWRKKIQPSISSTALDFMYPEHVWLVLSGGLHGPMYLLKPSVYYV